MNDNVKSHPKISVVIPSYKSEKLIFRCLEALMNQTIHFPYEVIVVDSSPKDISSKISEQFQSVRMVHLKEKTLPGKARSIGGSQAKGNIVFFTDADCIVDPEWIEKMLAQHQNGYDIVGGSVKNGTPHHIIGLAEYLLEFVIVNPWLKSGLSRLIPTCSISINRKVFEEIGFFPNYLKAEDTIFCERAIAVGKKMYFESEAKITHMNRTRLFDFIKNQIALGEGANEGRKIVNRPGRFLFRYPILIPLVPLYRSLKIGYVWLTCNRKMFFLYLLIFPIIAIGLIAHLWGFIRGCRHSNFL